MQSVITVSFGQFKSLSLFSLSVGGHDDNVFSIHGAAFARLYKYIKQITGVELSDVDIEKLKQGFKIKTFRRLQYLLQEGDVCRYMCFITSGALRMYSINEKRQEAIVSFGLEENWMSDQESLLLQTSSLYNIEAVEETTVLMISLNQFRELAAGINAFDKMVRVYDHQQAIATQKRIPAVISLSAEARYQDMLVSHPQYSQRFS